MINVIKLILKIVNFPFLMVMFLALHPMETISFNTSALLVADFNSRNKLLTQKLLKQGITNFAKLFF